LDGLSLITLWPHNAALRRERNQVRLVFLSRTWIGVFLNWKFLRWSRFGRVAFGASVQMNLGSWIVGLCDAVKQMSLVPENVIKPAFNLGMRSCGT